jgi:hypothetical protein
VSPTNLDLAPLPTELLAAVVVSPCGPGQVHLVGVDVLQEDYSVQVAREQTTLKRRDNGWRGSCVVMTFFDDENHYFEVTFQFQKGVTYVARSGCSPFAEPPTELWRS